MKNVIPVTCALTLVGVVIGVRCARRTAAVEPIVWYGNAAHPYIEEVRRGVEAFAREVPGTVYLTVGQEWTQDNQNQNVEALSTRGHRGYALYPADPAGANGLFNLLTNRGCRVVAFGAEPAIPTPATFTVATDISGAARAATEELIRLMGGKGRILNLLEAVTDVNTVKRDEAIREVVATHPEVEIVQTLSDMIQIGEATTKIQSALAARGGEIDGMIATGFNPTVAATAILTEWHKDPRHRRIRFVGIDTDPTVLKALREGAIDATVAQNPFGHGYLSCVLLDLMGRGWTPTASYQFIDSGIVIVNRDNLETFENSIREVTERLCGELRTWYLRPPQ